MRADSSTTNSAPSRRWESWVKWVSLGVMLVSALLLMRALPLERLSRELQTAVRSWGVWGPVWFGLIYAVAVVFFIPGSLLTLAGGAVFGLVEGTIVISLSATTGAAMAFLIARYLARERVRSRVQKSPRLAAVDKAIGEQGWKIVALLRLSPAVPFTLQNYLYGVTAIRFWPCVLTSWIAMLPGTFMYVYVGSLGSAAATGRYTSWQEWLARGVGLVATIILTLYITRLARHAMQEKIESETRSPNIERESSETTPKTSRLASMIWIVSAIAVLVLAIWVQFQKESVRGAIEQAMGLHKA